MTVARCYASVGAAGSYCAGDRDPEFGLAHFYCGMALMAGGSPDTAVRHLALAR